MLTHTLRERERERGGSAVRKQCDHYMIELCFVVPVAMLTRKIPSHAPGIAPVPSARVEVINFVRKTCCCAPGKHIMAISCQFATPSCFPPHADLLLPTNCLCVCVGHAALSSPAASPTLSLASFFAHFSQFVAPGFGLAFDLTRLGSLQPGLLCAALPCSGQGQCVALRICLRLCLRLCPGAKPGLPWQLLSITR